MSAGAVHDSEMRLSVSLTFVGSPGVTLLPTDWAAVTVLVLAHLPCDAVAVAVATIVAPARAKRCAWVTALRTQYTTGAFGARVPDRGATVAHVMPVAPEAVLAAVQALADETDHTRTDAELLSAVAVCAPRTKA